MGLIVEVHAAEGGMDAKDLVDIQFGIYVSRAKRDCLDIELLDSRPGLKVFRVSGDKASESFKNESGGLRFQRIPPTEKRGRVHTSTITVCTLPEPTEVELHLEERDLEWATTKGSGPGGQARNKLETCVILKHVPTGVTVRCQNERSLEQNKRMARSLLRAKLWEEKQARIAAERAADRKSQLGLGQRADKRRTIRYQDDIVTDHILGKRWRLKDYLKGDYD